MAEEPALALAQLQHPAASGHALASAHMMYHKALVRVWVQPWTWPPRQPPRRSSFQHVSFEKLRCIFRAALLVQAPSSATAVEADEQWLRGRDWSKEDPTGINASRVASASWSRLVRKPIKNGRHVILDMCVATPDQKSGQLERHIVAHSDRKRPWMGPAAYRLARRMKWGDLWPTIYHRNHRVQSCK